MEYGLSSSIKEAFAKNQFYIERQWVFVDKQRKIFNMTRQMSLMRKHWELLTLRLSSVQSQTVKDPNKLVPMKSLIITRSPKDECSIGLKQSTSVYRSF